MNERRLLTTAEVCDLLGFDPDGWFACQGGYPSWQFHAGRPIPGLWEILNSLPAGLTEPALYRYVTTTYVAYGGVQRPLLDHLRLGFPIVPAIKAAEQVQGKPV